MTWLQKGKIKTRLPIRKDSTLRKRLAEKENQQENAQSNETTTKTTSKYTIPTRTNIKKQTLTTSIETINAERRTKYMDLVKKNRQLKFSAFRENCK